MTFVETAMHLLDDGMKATFSLVGADEGEASLVTDMIRKSKWQDHIHYEGAIPPEGVKERLRQASLMLLPSIDEPFPMSVLEAMAAGRPVVVTESCGLAPIVRKWECGYVAALISSHQKRDQMGARARDAVVAQLSISAVVDQWIKVAEQALGRDKNAPTV
jgi:glycosyltransferase involved in cell wall biosynthesis